MNLSAIGDRMTTMSGLRSIMEDIATSIGESGDREWLNLSIGNPAQVDEIIDTWQHLTAQAVATDFAAASCQYGPSRGYPRLVSAIADYFGRRYGWPLSAENILVGPGIQMLTFIAAALYGDPVPVRPTRVVLPMTPDYTGYQAICMHPDCLVGIEPLVRKTGDRYFSYELNRPAAERCADIALLLASSPCNPTGRPLDRDELAALVRLAEQRQVPLLVDHAYGEPFPMIACTQTGPAFHPSVINCFSFSKAGIPGERIGFAIGPASLIEPMLSFLSNSSLHASRLAQSAAAIALESGELDRLVSGVITPFYSARRKAAEKLLIDAMPTDVDWRMHSAEGGMYIWVWMDEDWFDDLRLYQLLKTKQVFVTPGRSFFPDFSEPPRLGRHATQCFRLTLTVDEAVLTEGIKRIGAAVDELRLAAS